jgi:DNA-binding LytR/AlgR family response regulator
MNILIFEDEQPAARRIVKLVQELLPQATITGTADSISTAKQLLNSTATPDLILADIQLADGLSFEIFEHVPLQCPVIFTTAFDEYAIRAFNVNSIDYLLKPIDRNALSKALTKYNNLFSKGAGSFPPQLLQQLMQQLNANKTAYKTRFIVYKGAQLVPVAADEIAWFVTEDRVLFLHTFSGQRYICEHTLDELETLLDPADFYRANRQFVVSAKAVRAAENGFNGKLHVYLNPAPEEAVVVSREKAMQFRTWLAGMQ